MNFLFTISLRNLLRQKRRSILLGTAITFGTAILVLANAFAHGISEVIFNEIISYTAGHVSVSFTKGGNSFNQVFHDGDRMMAIVKERVPRVKRIEEAIGIFARAIGNGKADNVMLIGMDPDTSVIDEKEKKKLEKNFRLVEGDFATLGDTTVENPVGLAVDKARALNVKCNDVIRVRFTDLNGRTQAVRLTVTMIFKPSNVFMSYPVFLHIKTLKRLAGYGPRDIAALYLTIDDPKRDAKKFADSLHAGLRPSLAVIDGEVIVNGSSTDATLLALKTDSISLASADSTLRYTARTLIDTANRRQSVIASPLLASRFGIKPGDTCRVRYDGRFDSLTASAAFVVTAIADSGCGLDGATILVNEKDFYKTFYDVWPKSAASGSGPFRPDSSLALYRALGGEWLLAPRSKTTQDVMKRYREIAQMGWKAIVVDVGSMYETASMVLNVEYALNLITFAFVLLLFFIILIGVVNTLRMTIRERTREIGTMRAIGMQRNDVRNSFMMETGLLALFSAIAGIVVAFAAMWGLSRITFKMDDNPLAMMLVEGHLSFAPTVPAIVFFVFLIVAIAMITAYFPARRAARLAAADALRHFE